MNRPPSCGQHFRMGKSKRLTSLPFWITSLHAPDFTLLGKHDPSSPSFGSLLTSSRKSASAAVLSGPAELYHEPVWVLPNVQRESAGLSLTPHSPTEPPPRPHFFAR